MSTLNYCSSMSQPSCFSMSSENCSSMSQPASSSISQHGSSFISPQNCSSLSQPDYSMSSQNCSSVSQNDYSSISSQYCSSISQPASSSISQPARSSISQPASPSISPQNFSSLSQPDYSSISYQNCSSISQTDYSSISPLSCSSVSQPACSSTSSQTCSSISQTDYSSTSPKTCSSISKSTLSSTSSQSCSSISQSTFSTTSPQTCSSISQSTFSPTLPHSCSSMSQPACSSISPQTCFSISQTERSSTSTQNCSSISQSTFSSISPQTCSSISQSTCSSTSPQTCSSISLTDYSSTSPQTCSSISQSTCSSTSPQTCSSISLLTCSSTSPQTSSSISLSTCSSTSPQSSSSISQSTCSSKSPQTGSSISQNHYSSILSVNCSSTPSQINTTAYCCDIPHNCRNFTSTNSNSMHSYTVTPDSTQDLQSQASIELDFVSYCAETSVPIFNDHSSLSGHQSSLLSTKPNTCPSVCNNSLTIGPSPTSIGLGPTSFSNTPPVPLSSCLSYPFHTVSTNIPPNDPETLSCCPHVFFTGSSPMYVSSPEEQKEAKQCEICKASVEHTVRMEQDRQLCEQFLDSLSRFEDWLQMAQIATTLPNPFKTIHREAKLALRKYEVLLREMREKLLDLESLNRQYWQLTQTSHQTLLPSVLRSRMQEVNMFWDHLQGETETIHQTLKSRVQQREEFDTDQEDMKLCLTEMDLELSSVEYIYGGNSTEKIQQLKVFQEDVWSNMKRVECLLERGDQLIDNSDPRDAETLEEEMTQLGSYCQEIFIRLSRLQKRLVSTKLVFEDDFLDGGLEHVSSGSSDVFLDLDIEDGEVPSPLNVPVANVALVVDLEWDPLGDVGRSSSHDGQESFYTATSAPWKIFQRSEGSQGSFSSDSGVTNSKLRSQVDPEPLGPQEQIDNQGVVETTSVPHNSLPEMETGRGEGTFSCSVSLPIDGLDSVPRMDNPHLAPGRCWVNPDKILPVTSSDARVIDSQSHHNVTGHRRRQGKRKRAVWTQDGKRKLQPAKQEVSILMENGDDMSHLKPYKTSSSSSSSLCLWMKRLATFSVLLLLLCGAFLIFPLGRSSCSSPRFTWSLMLTYVNGPPPT